MRLDQYLSLKFPDKTRTFWQRNIKKGLVTVDSKVITKPSHLLENDQEPVISVAPECMEESPIQPENIPLDIIYEDNDLLVVDKPSSMVVHPAYGHGSGTLVNALLYHCKSLSGIGGVKRPGIVHRLDKDTSGLMVVAKNDEAHTLLAKQFHPDTKQASRIYQAVVHGVPQKMSNTLEFSMMKDPRFYERMKVGQGPNSKPAITTYQVTDVIGDTTNNLEQRYSVVECELFTGRTHQIRVHLSHIRNPIVGDVLYGSPRKDLRLMLHAKKLSFIHPKSQKSMTFHSKNNLPGMKSLFKINR